MSDGLQHVHLRKRIHSRHEPFPAPSGAKRIVDKLVYIVGIVMPLMSLPQLLNIWSTKDGSGLSLVTWGAFVFHSSFWLYYGLLHKDRPLIVANTMWLTLNFAIFTSAIIYR